MTFPPTDSQRRFSLIPTPPRDHEAEPPEFSWAIPPTPEGEPVEADWGPADALQDAVPAETIFEASERIEFAPLDRPAYADPDAPMPPAPPAPEPTARDRFLERQAQRETRTNDQGFDWGVEDDAPRERGWDWHLFGAGLWFVFLGSLIYTTFQVPWWQTPAMAVAIVCVALDLVRVNIRYGLGDQFKALLVDMRLVKREH